MLDYVDKGRIKRILSSRFTSDTLIATISQDGNSAIGFAWDISDRISANFSEDYNCIHSNAAIFGLKPKEEEIRYGKIYFLKEGGLLELYKQYKNDYAKWRIKGGI